MSKMIAVTMGDPAGIGPEIIIKSLAEGALSGAPVVVVGCAQTLRRILALNITPRAELRIINHPAAGAAPWRSPGPGRGSRVSLHQAGDRAGAGGRGRGHRYRAAE